MNPKKLTIVLAFFVIVAASVAAQQPAVELSFTFTRQSGSGSNQYAVWIEDAQGKFIKTLYATNFTAAGGWKRRETSIPLWVKKSNLSGMSKTQVDAITGSTPKAGNQIYRWDGTDSGNKAVSAGDYVIILEATLRNDNQVYYRTPFKLGQGNGTPKVNVEYVGSKAENEKSMIGDVKVRVLR
jgi:hypothetical protein